MGFFFLYRAFVLREATAVLDCMWRVPPSFLRRVSSTMSNYNTKLLQLESAIHTTKPSDFGLMFSDAESNSSSSFQDPCEILQVSFTSDVTQQSLEKAAAHIRAGELVAFPTETVYGLGACALRTDAAERIYRAKNRPADNPLIVHISDRRMLSQLVPKDFHMNKACDTLIKAFWPGPLTLLFPVGRNEQDEPYVPTTVTCDQPTVGIRMPSHPVARALIAMAGVPIAAPSANASGRPSPTTAEHVLDDLGQRQVLSCILDGGKCDIGLESTVVDATTVPNEVRILRPGGISVEQLTRELNRAGLSDIVIRVYGKDLPGNLSENVKPTTPGMKYRHYSPEARVILIQLRENHVCTSMNDVLHDALSSCVEDHVPHVGVMCALDSPLVQLLKVPDLVQWTKQATMDDYLSPVYRTEHFQLCFYSLGYQDAPDIAARRLFDGLRTLDACVPWHDETRTCDVIISESLPEHGVGLAIMNRLKKAASRSICVRKNGSA